MLPKTASTLLIFALGPGLLELGQAARKPSPLETHQTVRSRVHGGKSAAAEVSAWIAATGDHSFDGLRTPSPALQAALELQLKALADWDGGRLEEALDGYSQAVTLLLGCQSLTEAGFCRYYRAEILAQQERLDASLRELEEAYRLARAQGLPRPYLQALILQSRGYALWLKDDLQGSILAFGQAQRRWQAIGFPDGMAANWNNLAGLYEDLGFPGRAEQCYRQAFQAETQAVFPEIRLQLRANYALFLQQNGRRIEALAQLEKAREWRQADPFEFLLLESRLLHDAESLGRLQAEKPGDRLQEIERTLALAELASDSARAETLYNEALALARQGRLGRLRRTAAQKMGRWLEAQGRFREAASLYSLVLHNRPPQARPEYIFPYSRAHSPLFDGWIRCLVELGRPDWALREIQRRLRERRQRAVNFMRDPPRPRTVQDDLDRFVEAVELEADAWIPGSHESPAAPRRSAARPGYCVVEFWPDSERVFAWIKNAEGLHFQVLELGSKAAELVSQAVDPFYQAGDWLPPAPPDALLQQLHRSLIQPIEHLLDCASLLVVGHKELQTLPVELLRDESGRWLLERFNISYLPNADIRPAAPTPNGPPLLLIPADRGLENAAREEEILTALFPEALLSRGPNSLAGREALWIHVSSHFELDLDFWLASSPEEAPATLTASSFLTPRFSCSLLSLGVCDAGNSYSWAAPYWMNLAELLLTRPIGSLLISRWKMDEHSSEIFLEFFRLCKKGVPMDESLALARRRFLKRSLTRGGVGVPAEHPFFWAGISYVGEPGRRLYPPARQVDWAGLLAALALGGAGVWVLRLGARRGEERI